MRYRVMLAKTGDKAVLQKPSFLFEPKLDGTRVLVYKEGNNIELINRRNRDITYRYPELLDIPLNIKAKSCVLDAELVVLNKKGLPDFNLLQQREQIEKKFIINLRSKQMPATLFVFDLLEKNGEILINKPLWKRKNELEKIIVNGPLITVCPFTQNGPLLWKKVVEKGLEGVMAKALNSSYEQGKRSWAWLKIKNLNTIDALVVGFTKGTGARAESFGALVLAAYAQKKLVYIGKVGTGFSKKLLKQILVDMEKLKTKRPALCKDEQLKIHEEVQWIKPKLIAEVKFMELTKEHELRAPSFMRLRFDKRPEDCVLE